MFDIGTHSQGVLSQFSVEVTVTRSGEDDRTEVASIWEGLEEWHTHDSVKRRNSLDTMEVAEGVDIAPDDVITCTDTRLIGSVVASVSWTVRDRLLAGDRHTNIWRIVEQKDAE